MSTLIEALQYTMREDGRGAKSGPILRVCSDHLKSFVEDSDQNLTRGL
jgi:hypothetical protein